MVIAGFKESSRYITKASCGWRIGRGNHSYSSTRGDLRMETWCRPSRARRTGRKERIPATIIRDRPSRSSASETHPWHRFPRGVDSILLRRSPPSPANKAHSHLLPIVQKANIRELMERMRTNLPLLSGLVTKRSTLESCIACAVRDIQLVGDRVSRTYPAAAPTARSHQIVLKQTSPTPLVKLPPL